jgi:hypothetical protein
MKRTYKKFVYPKLENGGNFGFTPGGSWEIIKDFKGPSHEGGGIDIKVGDGQIQQTNGSGSFKAKDGVLVEKPPKEISSITGGKTIWNIQSNELKDRYNRTAIKAIERQPLEFVDKRKQNVYIGIPDKRTFDVAMNIPITDTNKQENGLQLSALDSIKKYWKKEDVPTAIAWAGQESTYGAYDDLFHLGPSTLKEQEDKLGRKLGNIEAASLIYYDKMAKADKLGLTKEVDRLQLLQGNGSIALGHKDLQGATKIFGWDLTKGPLDFKKNPKHGQRLIDIRDNNIITNEELMKHINQ